MSTDSISSKENLGKKLKCTYRLIFARYFCNKLLIHGSFLLKNAVKTPIFFSGKQKGEFFKVDNIANYNSLSSQNAGVKNGSVISYSSGENLTCFNDSWSDNAADAVGEAFSNMDDFLVLYRQSTEKV